MGNIFKKCKQKGLITSLDPNVRPILINDRESYIKRLERMFYGYLKASDEDLTWLYPSNSIDHSLQPSIKTNAKLLILTFGEKVL